VRRDGAVKLTDFGIARLLGAPDPAAAQGHAFLTPGTGAYMSPEQVLSEPLDGRSDLYSAGIVFYEMLSGRLPFPLDGRTELLMRLAQVETPPPPIRTWLPQAPPVLDPLFARALAKPPAGRFGSAIEMGEAFRTALGLPDTELWRAQAELARVAPTVPGDSNGMKTLRDLVARGNSTLQMPAR
jgi:serine/threonine-protein kinase